MIKLGPPNKAYRDLGWRLAANIYVDRAAQPLQAFLGFPQMLDHAPAADSSNMEGVAVQRFQQRQIVQLGIVRAESIQNQGVVEPSPDSPQGQGSNQNGTIRCWGRYRSRSERLQARAQLFIGSLRRRLNEKANRFLLCFGQ